MPKEPLDDIGGPETGVKPSKTLHNLKKAELIQVVEELRRVPRRQILAMRAVLLVAIIVSCGVYLLWDEIKPYIGQQTAEVATITLEDETVQVKVGEFAKELLSQLIGHYSTDEGSYSLFSLTPNLLASICLD